MNHRRIGLCAVGAAMLATSQANAREPYDEVYFVRIHANTQALFDDRSQCRREAFSMGDTAAAYSDPNYGAITAMGQALDTDALHGGGLRKRMQRAIFIDCMKRRGWTQLDPSPGEAKAVSRSSLHHPDVLDAWLKAHEPAPAPIAVAPLASPATSDPAKGPPAGTAPTSAHPGESRG